MENEGWIDWAGGECPVPAGVLVDVQFRRSPGLAYTELGADYLVWGHSSHDSDIIAYRLSEQSK